MKNRCCTGPSNWPQLTSITGSGSISSFQELAEISVKLGQGGIDLRAPFLNPRVLFPQLLVRNLQHAVQFCRLRAANRSTVVDDGDRVKRRTELFFAHREFTRLVVVLDGFLVDALGFGIWEVKWFDVIILREAHDF